MDTERCKSIDQISAMDASKSHAAGLRRTRPTTTEEVTNSGNYSGKRRRFDLRKNDREMKIQCRNGVDVNFREDVVSSTESGSNCDRVRSPNQEFSLDLKAELRSEIEIESETETSMSSNDGFSTRETSSSSEICLDSQQMESSMKNKPAASPSRRKPAPASSIMPTEAEIEEFFSVAEKKDQKRFANKYNYDIVNDVPMDGRYQWVRLKP